MGSLVAPKILERHFEDNLERYVNEEHPKGKRYVLIEWLPFIKESFYRTKWGAGRSVGNPSCWKPYDYLVRKIPKKLEPDTIILKYNKIFVYPL